MCCSQIYLTTGSFSQGVWVSALQESPCRQAAINIRCDQSPHSGEGGTRQCFPPENALVSCSLFLSWVNCATWSQLLGPGINSWAKVYSIRRWQDKGQVKDPPRSLLQGTFGCEMQGECQSPRCELLLLLLCVSTTLSHFLVICEATCTFSS